MKLLESALVALVALGLVALAYSAVAKGIAASLNSSANLIAESRSR